MKKIITIGSLACFLALGIAAPLSAQNFSGTKPAVEEAKKKAKAEELMNALTVTAQEAVDAVLPEGDAAVEADVAATAEVIVEEGAGVVAGLPDETEVEGLDEEGLVEIPIGIPPDPTIKSDSVPANITESSPAPAATIKDDEKVDHTTIAPGALMPGDVIVDHSQHMMSAPGAAEPVAEAQKAPAPAESAPAPILVAKPSPRVPAGASTLTVAIVPTTTTTPGLSGTLTLTDTEEGLWIKGNFQNVPDPGNHGIHIHENGSCADGGAGAGDHFNPGGVQHGHLPEHGHDHAHAGDMGNVQVKQDGTGQLDVVLPDVGLRKGKYLVGGKAIILHASADVFSQPTGNAGARIGCGIIPEGK